MTIYEDSILSYAYVLDTGDDFHAVNVFTIDEEENQYIENFIFCYDIFANSYYYELDVSSFMETNLLGLIDALQPEFWSHYQESSKDQYLGARESVIESGRFYDGAMEEAFSDYVDLVENYRLVDLFLWEEGTYREELIKNFQTEQDYEALEGIEGAQVLSYNYDDSAAIDLYFVDDQLVYMGAHSVDIDLDEFGALSSQEFDGIAIGDLDESLAEFSLPIIGFGLLNFDAKPVQTVAVAVDQFGQLYEGHLLVANGQVLDKKLLVHDDRDVVIHDRMILMANEYLSE